ncbi:unnamed protein product, partial [Diabrotica balteata]
VNHTTKRSGIRRRYLPVKTKVPRFSSERYIPLLNISKTKSMRVNARDNTLFTINIIQIENVENFMYLGNVITKSRGAEDDICMSIRKAQQSFSMLNPFWRSGEYTTSTKIRIFQSNVMSVLLYGCETWKVAKTLTDKLQVFIYKFLRRSVRILWPNIIRNEDLLHLTDQKE